MRQVLNLPLAGKQINTVHVLDGRLQIRLSNTFALFRSDAHVLVMYFKQ